MLDAGNPKVVAPVLYARLSRLDQRAVSGAFERRLERKGQGDPRYPDDEDPISVARKAFLLGTFVMFFFLKAFPFVMVWAGAMSFVIHGEANSVSLGIAVVSGSVALCLTALWGIRVAEIFNAIPKGRAVSAPNGTDDGSSTRLATPQRRLFAKRSVVLVLSVGFAALAVFPIYDGPFVMAVLYTMLFGSLFQVVVWKLIALNQAGADQRDDTD